jgi:hypothetical protein
MRKENLILYGGVFWAFWSLAVWCSSPRDSLYLDQSEQFATTGATECPEVKFNLVNYCQTGAPLQKCNPEAPPCSGKTYADCTLKVGTGAGMNEPAEKVIVAGTTTNCSDKGSTSHQYQCIRDASNRCVAGDSTGPAVPCIGDRTVKENKAC